MRGFMDVNSQLKARVKAHLFAQVQELDEAREAAAKEREAERERAERAERAEHADAARRGMEELKARRAKDEDHQ